MGLHQELTASMDDLALDQRRRIFWCAWEMEVAVSAAFRRPIRTLNKYISAAFPNCSQSPSSALHSIGFFIWRFRQLEAELISILYSNDPLTPEVSPLEDWMASMENKVCDWAQEVQQSAAHSDCPSTKNQWCEMVLYADIAYHHCLVLLYGPSNRVKTPTRSNIKRAFQASVRVAVGYWEQANTEFGRIKYTFHTCYHTFSAAVVFLRVLRSCKSDITQLFTLAELEDCASCFVRILSSIGERWPAAARCLEEFNRLLRPIMKSYSDFFLFAQHDGLLQQNTEDPFQTARFFAEAFDVLDYENFIQFFNPPPGVVEGSLPTPPAVIPFDWDIEFEFGMNELPVDGLDFT